MHRNEHSVQIERPAAAVFPYLTDGEKLRQWVGGLVESTALTEGGARVGARSREVVEERGQRFELETEITRYAPNEVLQARITSKGFETLSTYRLQEDGGRTRLTSVLESRYTMLLARLLAPIVTRQAQKKLEADLDRLKRLVEA
jgi:uncharacterized protein YndB with AHSA1/START domain